MGIKTIETRSWRTNYRGIIAIHAGKKFDKDFFTNPLYLDLINKYNITFEYIHFSCVVATCDIIDVIRTDDLIDKIDAEEYLVGNYSSGRYGWILDNIHPLKYPIPRKGHLGLWETDCFYE